MYYINHSHPPAPSRKKLLKNSLLPLPEGVHLPYKLRHFFSPWGAPSPNAPPGYAYGLHSKTNFKADIAHKALKSNFCNNQTNDAVVRITHCFSYKLQLTDRASDVSAGLIRQLHMPSQANP